MSPITETSKTSHDCTKFVVDTFKGKIGLKVDISHKVVILVNWKGFIK